MFAEDLQTMLGKHNSTLEELTVGCVFLVGSWDEVLSAIKNEPRLKKLVLNDLFALDKNESRLDREDTPFEQPLDGKVEFNGNEMMASGIDVMISVWNRIKADPDPHSMWKIRFEIDEMGHLRKLEDWEEQTFYTQEE
jgi:hypothetical protein